MTFMRDLYTLQEAQIWAFEKTPDALKLQKLLDEGRRQEYSSSLKELIGDPNNPRQFTRTKGTVYEMFDRGETTEVSIKFEVKGSVITWYFIAPMDRTHQSFRDLIFNTAAAAAAHAHVTNSCETYYRGTNSLHLKAMHLYAQESEFNHNHYRTADGGPITPIEVYQHLIAFCAQANGQKFIPNIGERDSIILSFAQFWAEFDVDIKYVIFSAVSGAGGWGRMEYQLQEIAKIKACDGELTPDEADKALDNFFVSKEARDLFVLAEHHGLPDHRKRMDYKQRIKAYYREYYEKLNMQAKMNIISSSEDKVDMQKVIYSVGSEPGAWNRLVYQLQELAEAKAQLGQLTPAQASKALDDIFSSNQDNDLLLAAECCGFSGHLFRFRQEIKALYHDLYQSFLRQKEIKIESLVFEDNLESPMTTHSSHASSKSASLRDDYLYAKDQIFDEVDKMELNSFADDLTKHCHSIDKELLEDMELEDFRKGILLYHALRTVQESERLYPEVGKRFHPDVLTDKYIRTLIDELPSLQLGSTEDELGSLLLVRLLEWVQNAPPQLDHWVQWVKVNGSRGLGSELAQVRQQSGSVDLRQAVPQGDRAPDANIAEIDFGNVNLKEIFIHEDERIVLQQNADQVEILKKRLAEEMNKLRSSHQASNKLPDEAKTAKISAIDGALALLAGQMNRLAFQHLLETNPGWNRIHSNSSKRSSLESIVNEILILGQNPSNMHSAKK